MREGYLNRILAASLDKGLQYSAKPLFWNMLHASPCESRFCADPLRNSISKSIRINILENTTERTYRDKSAYDHQYPVKSLFRKILAISPCGSRFCGVTAQYPTHKSLEMNILQKQREKNRETLSAQIPGRRRQLARQPRPLSPGRLLVSSGWTAFHRRSRIVAASY